MQNIKRGFPSVVVDNVEDSSSPARDPASPEAYIDILQYWEQEIYSKRK